MQGQSSNKRAKKNKKKKKKPATPWIWSDEPDSAFRVLKEKLTNPSILAIADYTLPFKLHKDAVLYQKQDGKDRVIAYASRGLRPSEKNYPAHKLEFLALKWAVTNKFHDYLYGTKFEVVTDNNPLLYVMTSAKLDATVHRWVAALSNYNFSITYRPGSQNANADALSRMPTVFDDVVKAICHAALTSVSLIDALAGDMSSHSAGDDDVPPAGVCVIDWKREQRQDKGIAYVSDVIMNGSRPSEEEIKAAPVSAKSILREYTRLFIDKGILYRTAKIDGQKVQQIVIPESHRTDAFKGVHDEVGHSGKDKTVWLARQRFFWPGLEKDICTRVESCGRCIRRNPCKNLC